tara:strand:+ start:21609 stop:22166 length:558 start_codon:yes stop_codon:yes gene_type:complete
MPRCKNCKELFEKKYFNQKFCLSDICTKAFSDWVKEQNWKKEKKKRERDLQTLQELVNLAQIVFNRFIRLRDQKLPCVSCGGKLIPKPKYSAQYDASHYYNANNHWNIRFNEDNVHASCTRCNKDLHGNLIEYRKELIQRIGEDKVNHLDDISRVIRKFTKDEIRELTLKYKDKVKKMKINIKKE